LFSEQRLQQDTPALQTAQWQTACQSVVQNTFIHDDELIFLATVLAPL